MTSTFYEWNACVQKTSINCDKQKVQLKAKEAVIKTELLFRRILLASIVEDCSRLSASERKHFTELLMSYKCVKLKNQTCVSLESESLHLIVIEFSTVSQHHKIIPDNILNVVRPMKRALDLSFSRLAGERWKLSLHFTLRHSLLFIGWQVQRHHPKLPVGQKLVFFIDDLSSIYSAEMYFKQQFSA